MSTETSDYTVLSKHQGGEPQRRFGQANQKQDNQARRTAWYSQGISRIFKVFGITKQISRAQTVKCSLRNDAENRNVNEIPRPCLPVPHALQALSKCTDTGAETLLERQMIKYVRNLSHRRCVLNHLVFQQTCIDCSSLKTLPYVPKEEKEQSHCLLSESFYSRKGVRTCIQNNTQQGNTLMT